MDVRRLRKEKRLQKNRIMLWGVVGLILLLSVLCGRSRLITYAAEEMVTEQKESTAEEDQEGEREIVLERSEESQHKQPPEEEQTTEDEKTAIPRGRHWIGVETGKRAYVCDKNEIMPFSTEGADCTITPGSYHSYGSWSTTEFDVRTDTGTHNGYCAQPNKSTPSGTYKISILNDDTIKALLLLAPGGAWYYKDFWNIFGYNPATGGVDGNDAYSLAHACIGYAYTGSTTGLSADDVGEIQGYIEHARGEINNHTDFGAYTVYVAYNNAQDIVWIEKNPIGNAKLKKSSSNLTLTADNSCYSLDGAIYGVYSDASCGTKVAELRTNRDGNSNTVELEEGNYWVKEITAPDGFVLDMQVYPITVTSGNTSVLNVEDIPQNVPITLLLQKVDKMTGENTPQGGGSLADAEFTVKYYLGYYDMNPAENGIQPAKSWVMKTDAKGQCYFREAYRKSGDDFYRNVEGNVVLPLGTLTIQETKAPKGYLCNEEIYTKKLVPDGNTEEIVFYQAMTVADAPIAGGVSVEKWDHEKNQRKAQGGATLQGTRLQILSLNDNPIVVNGKKYDKNDVIVTMTTNEQGRAQTSDHDLPYGKYRVREVAPPEGYLSKGVLQRDFTISRDHEMVSLNTANTALKNDVIRGDIQILKFKEDSDSDQEQKTGLSGIVFTITSKTTGESVRITTDDNGYASTKQLKLSDRGNLVYDTYIVQETNTPKGLKPVEDFEVVISEEGKTLHYILEDKLIVSPVQLVKKDSTTGNIIPLANARFQLLDAEKNVMTMTTYYPRKEVHKEFRTDETGSFILPEKLPAGTYYFREVEAPKGYLLGEDLEFQITKGHVWEEPFVVEYTDTPVMGKIRLLKRDAETEEPLTGAVFEIIAAEDVVACDGTVRLLKGEVADTVTTDEEGLAMSEELYLGKYLVRETRQPEGFVLSKEEYPVVLEYQDQNTELVVETIEVMNQPTHLKIIKTDAETKVQLSGVKYAVWNQAMLEEPDEQIGQEEIFVTDEEGIISIRHLPPGTYCLQEIETLPGYVLDPAIHEITIAEDGRVIGEDTGALFAKNIPTKLIETSARDADSGDHQAVPQKDTLFIDVVKFEDLQIGQEYRIKGTLIDRETGKPLLVHGEKVEGETIFTAETSDGTVDVEFTFDSRGLDGHSLVVFEEVFIEDTKIMTHADINNEMQTITFSEKPQKKPEAATGDDSGWLMYALFSLASVGLLMTRAIRNSERKRHSKGNFIR